MTHATIIEARPIDGTRNGREPLNGQILVKLTAASAPNGSEASGPPTSSRPRSRNATGLVPSITMRPFQAGRPPSAFSRSTQRTATKNEVGAGKTSDITIPHKICHSHTETLGNPMEGAES